MTSYHDLSKLEWQENNVRGTIIGKSSVFEGDFDLRSAYFRMPKGCRIEEHHHSKWVQVAVLKGAMEVEQDGKETQRIDAGGVYFIQPGETHVEYAVEDTVVLVTQGEDRG